MEILSGDALIHYESFGQGEPLVLLHGNGEDMHALDAQIDAFSARYQVLAVDSRGHGASSAGTKALSLYDMAEDVLAVLDDAGAERAHLVGFSDGGNIALIFACRHPERVGTLTLSGANCDPAGLRYGFSLRIWLEQFALKAAGLFSQRARRKKELVDLMVREPKLKKWDLEAIGCPVLLTAGEHDVIRPGHTQYLHRNLKDSELEIFPGDHFSPMKRPAEYNARVLAFLQAHPLPAIRN